MILAEIFFIGSACHGILAKCIVFITLSMWDNKRQVTLSISWSLWWDKLFLTAWLYNPYKGCIFFYSLGKKANEHIPQNVKLLLQVVVARVQACMMIKWFHYLYESPHEEGNCSPCNSGVNLWIDWMTWFSSSGVLELEAQEETASPDRELPLQCRNLPTNPCLWLGLWRCMSLLDISCQLALGTLDSILLVHILRSDSLGRCRTCKPLECLPLLWGTKSWTQSPGWLINEYIKNITQCPELCSDFEGAAQSV